MQTTAPPSKKTHCISRLKKSKELQQYTDIYLLLNYSKCFGVLRAHYQEYIKLKLYPLVQTILYGEQAFSNVTI